jgi:hypothetical protein
MLVGIDVSKDRLDVHLRPAAETFCLARGDTTGLQSEVHGVPDQRLAGAADRRDVGAVTIDDRGVLGALPTATGKTESAQAASRLLPGGRERVIFTHARGFERGGTVALRRSLAWLLT